MVYSGDGGWGHSHFGYLYREMGRVNAVGAVLSFVHCWFAPGAFFAPNCGIWSVLPMVFVWSLQPPG